MWKKSRKLRGSGKKLKKVLVIDPKEVRRFVSEDEKEELLWGRGSGLVVVCSGSLHFGGPRRR